MAATKAAAQMGVPDAATQAAALEAAMWAVASVTGTRDAALGAMTRVEAARRSRTWCTGAGDPSSASGYATADEILATGSN